LIYTPTLNPAVDRELRVAALEFDTVLRADSVRVDCGGKGFNVARALAALGTESVAVGLVGGIAGQVIAAGLNRIGIRTDFVDIAGETRTNVTVIWDTHHIKVNEAGPQVTADELDRLIGKVHARARLGDWWVLSGSLPPGVPEGVYGEVITILRSAGARAILDTSGPALRHGCAAGPYLAKPNAAEAIELIGVPVDSEEDLREVMERIHRSGAALVILSLGRRGAAASDGTLGWLARPPEIEERNPIGAGDALVAGAVRALDLGMPLEHALRWGVASGAAAAALDGTAVGGFAEVEALTQRVEITALGGRNAP